jgi:hypothetical protein
LPPAEHLALRPVRDRAGPPENDYRSAVPARQRLQHGERGPEREGARVRLALAVVDDLVRGDQAQEGQLFRRDSHPGTRF